MGGDERGGLCWGLNSPNKQRHGGGNRTEKVNKETEERSVTLWGGGKRGLSTQICLMHLKYVLQYLSFTFEHPKAAITKYCHIEDSAKLQMATLNHIILLFCAVQGPE